jgi:hypothetical protein
VRYIISSRGRPIGTTELDFARLPSAAELGFAHMLDAIRSGWFHPNSLGETLMPNVALQHRAVRAFVSRNVRADGQSIVQPEFRSSSLFGDLAEAFHRVEAMELTLHRTGGALIPTVQIGIQDTEELRELGRSHALHADLEPAIDQDEMEWDPEVDLARAGDPELPSGSWEPSDDADDDFDLDEIVRQAYEKLADLPRYQVHVELVDPSAIP